MTLREKSCDCLKLIQRYQNWHCLFFTIEKILSFLNDHLKVKMTKLFILRFKDKIEYPSNKPRKRATCSKTM